MDRTGLKDFQGLFQVPTLLFYIVFCIYWDFGDYLFHFLCVYNANEHPSWTISMLSVFIAIFAIMGTCNMCLHTGWMSFGSINQALSSTEKSSKVPSNFFILYILYSPTPQGYYHPLSHGKYPKEGRYIVLYSTQNCSRYLVDSVTFW